VHIQFPPEMLAEIHSEADRLGLKVSAVMRRVWRLSRSAIAALPPDAAGLPEGNDADA
jgi:uncharacterized small protein (TIGR04563 family)